MALLPGVMTEEWTVNISCQAGLLMCIFVKDPFSGISSD